MKIVYVSTSKKNFYQRTLISEFVLLNNCVPISPFMNFDYNLSGLVNKDYIRISNNSLIHKSNELWVFGELSDGVVVEIYLAKKAGLVVKYFEFNNSSGEQIKQINDNEVTLDDVSQWMWEWVISGKNLARWHPRLRFTKSYPLTYTAYSKHNFYWQMHISKFCIENKRTPLNPFMLFKYFLLDKIPRDLVYKANERVIEMCDSLWVFGEVADGVYKEVLHNEKNGKETRFYTINDDKYPVTFRRISRSKATLENELINQLGTNKI